jgi:hypothetical protein
MVALVLALFALMLALPAVAQAGTAGLVDKVSPWGGSEHVDDLLYRADPHESNRVSVTFTPGGARVVDRAGVRPGRHCSRVSRTVVRCTAPLGIDQVVMSLGDRDDRARVGSNTHTYDAILAGGPGDDVLISRARFRDLFIGGPGNDTMTGVAFGEVFDEGAEASGRDTMRANPTQRNPWTWVDYGKRRRPVTADPDGDRDDGEQGEGDLIGRGVTGVRGGSGADRLTGNDAPNRLAGAGGADVLLGRGGNDALIATQVGLPSRDPGADVLPSPTTDRLVGGSGEDLLEGSTGANELDGGPGADWILGLDGPDRIRARDADVDRIECGGGPDRALTDAIDFQADCELGSVFSPGPIPVVAHSYFEENRYPGDPPPRWVAEVKVGCSGDTPCTGSVSVLLDGEAVGTAPFAIESPYVYDDAYVVVGADVAALVKRRDPRISIRATTDATGRVASMPALGRVVGLVPIVPIVPSIPSAPELL